MKDKTIEVEQQYFSISEVATILGISKSSLRSLIKRGIIEAKTMDGMSTARISREELERYIGRAEVRHG